MATELRIGAGVAYQEPLTLPVAVKNAEQALLDFRLAAEEQGHAVEDLRVIQAERPRQKLEALTRLCQQPHPANGKIFSVTQAEDVLQIDPAYAEYRAKVTKAEDAAREAEDEKLATWLEAQLRVTLVKTLAGTV